MNQTQKPNILLILTDQQRGDCLSIDGHPDLFTPNLDGWAYGGVRFTQAYTPCPLCVPARRSILTGRSPASDGSLGNQPHPIEFPHATLPNLLRLAGYQTMSIGRNMHQYPPHKRYGFEINEHSPFQDFYSTAHKELRSGRANKIHWPHLLEHGLPLDGHTCRTWPYDETFHESVFSVNKAIECLDRRDKDDPFFMYVGFTAPHPPLVPPAFYFERYRRRELRPPAKGDWNARLLPQEFVPGSHGMMPPHPDYIHDTMAAYYGLINHIDDQLFRLIFRLQQEGEPTVVIFASDHGEMLGDHGLFQKCRPYAGSVRVPFFVFSVGTDLLSCNRTIDTPVSLVDLLPTICDLAHIEYPEYVEGKSLMPFFQSQGEAEWNRAMVHCEIGAQSQLEHQGFHVLCDGHHKYIWFSGTGAELFFDVQNDPRELHDLSTQTESADALQTFRAALVQHLEGRAEGFVQDHTLVAGQTHSRSSPMRSA